MVPKLQPFPESLLSLLAAAKAKIKDWPPGRDNGHDLDCECPDCPPGLIKSGPSKDLCDECVWGCKDECPLPGAGEDHWDWIKRIRKDSEVYYG